jgi:hypothetical protein
VPGILCDVERTRANSTRAEHELLLAVPDAIAWCWTKGGHWRDRVQPLATEVRSI